MAVELDVAEKPRLRDVIEGRWFPYLMVAPTILVLTIVAWWLAGREAAVSAVLAAAATVWLAGHGVAVDVGGLHLTVTPLLLTALLAWRLAKAADRAASLTRQLLAFGRKQFLRPVVLDLNDTVTELLQMLPRVIGESLAPHGGLGDLGSQALAQGPAG
jgi:hypothetical protein